MIYMEKNFMFNMPLEKFGYLTGRSITTFKRDFKKPLILHHKNGLRRKEWSWRTAILLKSIKSLLMCATKWASKNYRIFLMPLKNILAMHLQYYWCKEPTANITSFRYA
jgi:hypothetical protein